MAYRSGSVCMSLMSNVQFPAELRLAKVSSGSSGRHVPLNSDMGMDRVENSCSANRMVEHAAHVLPRCWFQLATHPRQGGVGVVRKAARHSVAQAARALGFQHHAVAIVLKGNGQPANLRVAKVQLDNNAGECKLVINVDGCVHLADEARDSRTRRVCRAGIL